jgi:hypothetical protein
MVIARRRASSIVRKGSYRTDAPPQHGTGNEPMTAMPSALTVGGHSEVRDG